MWSGTSFKFSIFRSGVTQEMAKAMRSGVEGWQAFVGVAPFLLRACRWLSLSRSVGFGFSFSGLEVGLSFFGWELVLSFWCGNWSFLLVVGVWAFLPGVRAGPPFLGFGLALARLSHGGGDLFLLAVGVRPPFLEWWLALSSWGWVWPVLLLVGVCLSFSGGNWPFLLAVGERFAIPS